MFTVAAAIAAAVVVAIMSSANGITVPLTPSPATGNKGVKSPAFIGGNVSYNSKATAKPWFHPRDISAAHNAYQRDPLYRKEGR